MNYNKTVYTIIVTYNGLKWINDCISSVYDLTKVIVVDNNSSDKTLEYIDNNYPKCIVLAQDKNLGFGKANNLGIKYGLEHGAEFLFLLNQDAKIFGNVIYDLVSFSQKNKDYGILSPIHCDWSGTYLESSFSRYVNYEKNEDFYSDFVLDKEKKEVYDVSFVAAACWFIPKKVFSKVGGFDPIFFHIGEDNNYTQRVLFHGFKIGVLPKLKVGHDTKGRIYIGNRKYSEKYYKTLNYRRKIKFADVNISNAKEKAIYLKNQLYKESIILFLQLKLIKFKKSLREIYDLKRLLKESLKSVDINRTQGKHYL
ncbi:glycosyltransferase family 2 protein [Polaribacter sp.]|uniref:glycosyltransferase family 2 protein n=1 Tax=Polaribacter sp. TaxID=1920175 RepID=UPI0035C78F88